MFLREGINTKAFAAAEKELKAYANKPGQRGGIDSKDFIDVAVMLGQISRINILQAGQKLAHLNTKLKRMDTSPREKVYSVLQKHGLMESAESIKEKMTEKQMKKREKIVKSMKKDKKGFEDRYGDKADAVMYATATKMAIDEKLDDKDKPFVKKLIKNLRKGSATHGKQADDLEKAMTSEEMDPTDHVKKKDGKYCVYNADGTIAKVFDNKADADKYAIDNHDKLMATKKESVKEDIERRADVKMVKVRLPDGTQVMRRQRPEIKIGEKKSPNAVRTEETINEGVIEDLKKIVKRKARADIKFANGRKTKVDLFTASAMTQVYDKLNDKNKKKFADAINKDERMFMKMMDFAMTKVGGK